MFGLESCQEGVEVGAVLALEVVLCLKGVFPLYLDQVKSPEVTLSVAKRAHAMGEQKFR
jgi:hypothetical protein